jgi:hypothetical protein
MKIQRGYELIHSRFNEITILLILKIMSAWGQNMSDILQNKIKQILIHFIL